MHERDKLSAGVVTATAVLNNDDEPLAGVPRWRGVVRLRSHTTVVWQAQEHDGQGTLGVDGPVHVGYKLAPIAHRHAHAFGDLNVLNTPHVAHRSFLRA